MQKQNNIAQLPPAELIQEKYNIVLERIRNIHIKCFPDYPEPLFLISNAYPGVWLHPITGQLSKSSEWYSSSMLFFIHSVKRLKLLPPLSH